MDGENDATWTYGAVIKIDTTGRQTTRPWVFKSADKCYHVDFLLIGMTSSLWTVLQAHLTQLRRHIDFKRRKQDILRLLTLPASGKTSTKRLSRSPPPVLGFGCFPAVLASFRRNLKYQRILNQNIPQNWIHNSLQRQDGKLAHCKCFRCPIQSLRKLF